MRELAVAETIGAVEAPAVQGRASRQGSAFRGHLPALDGVRGLAILMVMVLHFVGAMEPANSLERGIVWLATFGTYGVDLFFVLSGFLITGILVESRERPHYFRNFYMRRVLRIFPLYYGVLAVIFWVVPLLPFFQGAELDQLRRHQAWAWLYGVNLYIGIHGEWALSYIDHFWSLCVEEHFYFVWPFLVWLIGGRSRRLMWVSLGLSLGAMIARTVGNLAGLSWWTTYVLTPFRLDGLALGAFLALLVRQEGGAALVNRRCAAATWGIGALVAATFCWTFVTKWGTGFLYPVRAGLVTMFLALVLLGALREPQGRITQRFFRGGALRFLGKYSYGLYVYHHFVSLYMTRARTEYLVGSWVGSHLVGVLLQSLLGMGLSILVAYGSYELVEKRFLGLKRYFEAERVGASS